MLPCQHAKSKRGRPNYTAVVGSSITLCCSERDAVHLKKSIFRVGGLRSRCWLFIDWFRAPANLSPQLDDAIKTGPRTRLVQRDPN